MTLLTWLEPLRLGPAVVMQVGLLPGQEVIPEQVRRLPGYRVVANRVGDAWRYVAWGPDTQPSAWRYREYSNGQCRHWHPEGGRIRYPIGSAIPQRRLLLGAHPSAALAREQCQVHANAQSTVLITG
jgi:hypothetical protein